MSEDPTRAFPVVDASEIDDTRGTLRDLLCLIALPVLWGGRDAAGVLEALTDVLVGVLRLDVAYGVVDVEGDRARYARSLRVPTSPGLRLDEHVQHELERVGDGAASGFAGMEVRAVRMSLGLGDDGYIIVASTRADFPNARDHLLLRVATNQALIGLQGARLLMQRTAAEDRERERARAASVAAAVGEAFTQRGTLSFKLQRITAAVVEHLGAAFARIWTYDAADQVLVLRASAGLYTHIDGAHARIPLGAFKIGRIASTRQTLLTNDVPNDPHIGDPEWAEREGMTTFAGLPLVVEDRLIGVIALFARTPAAGATFTALGAIADEIALGIDRERADEERERLLQAVQERVALLRRLAEASIVINSGATLDEVLRTITDRARELIGAHQSVTSITRGTDWAQAINAVSLSEKYASFRTYDARPDGSGIYALVASGNKPLRMTQAELEAHHAWRGFGTERHRHPPMRGWLAVPLVSRTGDNIGLLQLSDRYTGEFTDEDEAILAQLAQMASVAIENSRLLDELARTVRFSETFVGILGHDLRNPLGAITIAAELLLQRHPEDRIARPIERIRSSAQRMGRMIEQILDFTRARIGGGIPIERKPVDLHAVASQIALELEGAAPQEIIVERAGDTSGRWDPDRLGQVISNLLGNAAQYGSADQPIRVMIDGSSEAAARVHVINGGAIPPEALPTLFDPFRRAVTDDRTRASKGLGLGLYIVEQIIHAHGGTIEVRSSPDEGTTFLIVLPRGNRA